MSQTLIYAIGFAAQLLFSARQITQWISSERAGRVLSPLLFWQLSIVASFLLMLYGILREDFAIVIGQVLTYLIYTRNLYFFGFWQKIPFFFRLLFICFPAIAVTILATTGHQYNLSTLLTNREIPRQLMIWGIAGQLVFTFRFVYQWICSEKRKESVLPPGFWLISISGSAMILSYAILRRDPVLFAGQIFGFVVYSRNLILGLRARDNTQQK
ncbi:lipid-A-disaccharide synthase N-terminal domain-containing protein [Desulforhopalus vacuolatus]|uniref:lipid-A-disaccharide synthase N-terminal domain-containing protein n=1 Tax=Desulforhopalus vacuolatus TaxID=40414 RepID=UPI00196379A0|nr:lipid-A-disaccharide synthase N-terminal domain-containing protein [Desulforhopalus vacuolatus]MBM9519292.1 lipid-A-disaccharide synthase N-terminal domain-containing protein [Desulforhopalus vacuolatus]